jgi:hypothetical protein
MLYQSLTQSVAFALEAAGVPVPIEGGEYRARKRKGF